MAEKHLVMAFGRMNPPTTGHHEVMKKVSDIAKKNQGDAHVIVSHSQDKKKNPLSPEDKVFYARKMAPEGVNVRSSSSEHPTLLHQLSKAHQAGYKHVTIVGGSDRQNFHDLAQKYNNQEGKHGYYNFKSINFESSGERDPDSDDSVKGMSGTKMREHARNNDEESFKKGLHPSLHSHANEIMSKINDALREEFDIFCEAMSITQRRKRALVMRRFRPKLVRMKKLISKKKAPEKNIMQRARKAAIKMVRKRVAGKKGMEYHKLTAAEKEIIDKRVAQKQAIVDKLARRLLPVTRKAELIRLTKSRNVKEEFNVFVENLVKKEVDTVAHHTKHEYKKANEKGETGKMLGKALGSLQKKAEKNQVDEGLVVEIFLEGLIDFDPEKPGDAFQQAFNSVNSFIAHYNQLNENLRRGYQHPSRAKWRRYVKRKSSAFRSKQSVSSKTTGMFKRRYAQHKRSGDSPVGRSASATPTGTTKRPTGGVSKAHRDLSKYGESEFRRIYGRSKSAMRQRLTREEKTNTDPMNKGKYLPGEGTDAARKKAQQMTPGEPGNVNEDLRQWFGKGPKGDWVRMDTKGNIKGDCAREPGEGKPKCLPRQKAHSMSKDDRAKAARRKRRQDPVADRQGKGGKPVNVATEEVILEKSKPTNPALWSRAKSLAKSKFDVYPSAYANGWAAKWYKSKGGGWKSASENYVPAGGTPSVGAGVTASSQQNIPFKGKKLKNIIRKESKLDEVSMDKADAAATERRRRMNKALDAGDLDRADRESEKMKKNVGHMIKKAAKTVGSYGEQFDIFCEEEGLGKIRRTPGGPKKFMVKVKDKSTGNVKTVRFGDPNLSIKRDNPERRKSFRARHNCANPGPRTKARYWSCKQWRASTPVQDSFDGLLSANFFLGEAATDTSKLTHLDHVEDHVINSGSAGFRHATDTLRDVHQKLRGQDNDTSITTKYDGSPSIVWGHHPETGKFFVGSKSVFNKNPKLNYTEEDIENNHGHAPGLVSKLKASLKHLPKITPKGKIYQGDLMHSGMKSKDNPEGDVEDKDGSYHFKPNTITYSTEKGSDHGKKIAASKLGVVAHTEYSGDSLDNMRATFNADTSGLKNHKDVHVVHAGVADDTNYPPSEQRKYESHMMAAHDEHEKAGDDWHSSINSPDHAHTMHMNTYINKTVRENSKPSVQGYKDHVEQQYQKKAEKVKTDAAKQKHLGVGESHLNHVDDNEQHFQSALNIHHHLQQAKNVLVNALSSSESHFDHHIGDEKVKPEGFVASRNNKPSKLVDRAEFSRANFLKSQER